MIEKIKFEGQACDSVLNKKNKALTLQKCLWHMIKIKSLAELEFLILMEKIFPQNKTVPKIYLEKWNAQYLLTYNYAVIIFAFAKHKTYRYHLRSPWAAMRVKSFNYFFYFHFSHLKLVVLKIFFIVVVVAAAAVCSLFWQCWCWMRLACEVRLEFLFVS